MNERFSTRVMAIAPEAVDAYLARLMRDRASIDKPAAAVAQPRVIGRVAVVPVYGVMDSADDSWGGTTSTAHIERTIAALGADKAVKTIVLDIDSPGGSVYGIPELGATVRDVASRKRVIAVANPMAASAAYWLASQAREIAVTPSGEVGSIGVISVHADWSGYLEQAGIKTTVITSSEHKGEFSPYAALSEDAKAEMQRRVDHFDGMFTSAVAQGRGVTPTRVRADFGAGRMVEAGRAKSLGMADRVATFDEVMSRLIADQADLDRVRAAVAHVEMIALGAGVAR